MKLGLIAQQLGARLNGTPDVDVRSAAGLREAGPGDISYVSDAKHLPELEQTRASAVIIHESLPVPSIPSLSVRNPRYAFARTIGMLYPPPDRRAGISDMARVAEDALIGTGAIVHPFVVVEARARVGSGVTLYPGVYVGEGSVIGDGCTVHANVTIREGVSIGNRVIIHAGTVVGSDGFGFVTDGGVHHKIPHVGGVIIEDDVELGANCAIDRAMLGNTVIKKGTKFDNMVHVAHNVVVGEHCLIAGQVGIAGSATVGNYVVMGGQVGIGDHTMIHDRVMVGGGSAITQETAAGSVVAGYYAMPLRDWLKVQATLPKLPEIRKRLSQLEKMVQQLNGETPSDTRDGNKGGRP